MRSRAQARGAVTDSAANLEQYRFHHVWSSLKTTDRCRRICEHRDTLPAKIVPKLLTMCFRFLDRLDGHRLRKISDNRRRRVRSYGRGDPPLRTGEAVNWDDIF